MTSALLTATYLVVGATGDGLYYLVEAPQVATATAGAAREHGGQGFAHDHGDGLWHHHGGHHDESVAMATQSRDGEGLFDRGDTRHHDHTTLLLAVASAIELSLLDSPLLAETSQAALLIGSGDADLASASDREGLGPRGPPAGGLA